MDTGASPIGPPGTAAGPLPKNRSAGNGEAVLLFVFFILCTSTVYDSSSNLFIYGNDKLDLDAVAATVPVRNSCCLGFG
eukprot:SAG31_NODE_1066_length_10091_cov_5.779323_3_plen_79_part_00